MDVGDPRCFSSNAFHQRVVVGEVGKASKARAALVQRRLVAVGPGCDVGGTALQLAPACKIHVDTGAANHEICAEPAPCPLQPSPTLCFSSALYRPPATQTHTAP